MGSLTKAGVRGCGSQRRAGKLYLCVGMGPDGRPIEDFIKDPPIPYIRDYHRFPILMADEKGINHVYMWVGAEEYYKSPWFHIEETRRLGLSRLVSGDKFKLEDLTPGESRIRLIYPYGIPKFEWTNQGEFYEDCHVHTPCYGEHSMPDRVKQCSEEVQEAYKFCSFSHVDLSYLLADMSQIDYADEEEPGLFTIHFPNKQNEQFTYNGIMPDVPKSLEINVKDRKNWQPAIILDLPISHFEMPYELNEEIADRVEDAGYDLYVTQW